MLRDILIPGTVPEILGGFRIALAGAWGLEAVAELLGSQSGIGKVLEVLAGATDPQGIIATLLVLGRRRHPRRRPGGHADRAVRRVEFCAILRRRTKCRPNRIAA